MFKPSQSPIAAVMIHAPDWREGLAWYRQAFPSAECVKFPDDEWECLEIDGVRIEVVPADAKVAAGAAGTVVYWRAGDFEATKSRLESLGAVLYRGPRDIENGMRMCQLKDPFGNLIGLRGLRGQR